MQHLLRFLRLNSDPAESAPPAPGAPPPAAALVTETDAREGDAAALVEARRKLQEIEDAKKQVELRNMELEDQVRTLSTPPPAPAPAPKKERAPGWLDMYRSPDGDASEA
jgi:hypothetical protein